MEDVRYVLEPLEVMCCERLMLEMLGGVQCASLQCGGGRRWRALCAGTLEFAGRDTLYAAMYAGGSGRCALFIGSAKGDALYAALYATLLPKALEGDAMCWSRWR